MDSIVPVATEINPPNIQQGLGTLASILGLSQKQIALKQAQQNLQTGQYQQQQQQGLAQQQQEMMRERQLLQQAQSSGKDDQGNSLNGPDGEPDPVAYTRFASRALPLIGQNVVQGIVKTQTDNVGLLKSSLGLSNDQRDTAAGIIRSAIGTNTPSSQIVSQVQSAIGNGASAQRNISSLVPLIAHLDNLPAGQMRDKALTHLADSYSPQAQVAASQTSAPTQSFAPSGNVQTTESNWKAPGGAGAQLGPQVKVGLGPTQTPSYAGSVAAASSRATGVGGIDVQRADQVSANVQPASAALPLTHEIDDLADQIHSGKLEGWVSAKAAALGIQPLTYARQLLEKDLGQVKAAAIKGAPNQGAESTILSGYPEATSDNQTIHTAMDYIRGGFRQTLGRDQNLLSYQKQHPDLSGFQQADDAFTSKNNPLAAEYQALKPGAERQGFLRRNFKNAQEAQAFVDQLK